MFTRIQLETLMKCLHFKTACMEKPSSLMQIPPKTTKARHGHIGKSFFFFFFNINNTLEVCRYKAFGFPVNEPVLFKPTSLDGLAVLFFVKAPKYQIRQHMRVTRGAVFCCDEARFLCSCGPQIYAGGCRLLLAG